MESARSQFDPFDRGNGNGSRTSTDDWLDQNSIFDNEWGSSAATTFNPNGTDGNGYPLLPHREDKFEKLYDWHNGKGERSHKEDIRQSYIVNDAKTFTSVLEMPERQRDTVLEILDEIDISSNNFGGVRYEKIILTICSLVSDEALGNQPNPSLDDRLFLTDQFRELMDCTGMSSSEHRKIRKRVRQESNYFK